MKTCGKCKKEKELSEFYHYKNKPRHWCKDCDRINTIIRQTIFKELCVEYKGGKCEKCGYSNYVGALDFHHKDPSQKEFGIARVKLRKFDKNIKKELDKCLLLCANCHREEHQKYEFEQINGLWEWYKKRKDKEILQKPLKDLHCKCGNKKAYNAKQCRKCKDKSFHERNLNEVLDKLKSLNYNFVQTAKFFNLSDNGLRKYLKSKGLNLKTLKG